MRADVRSKDNLINKYELELAILRNKVESLELQTENVELQL